MGKKRESRIITEIECINIKEIMLSFISWVMGMKIDDSCYKRESEFVAVC